MISIVFAVLFLVVLFLSKTTSLFKNNETYQSANQENGLIYSDATLEDLVNKDTDGDGVPNWQESLYGLDPTKKETTAGIPDSVAIEKLKISEGNTAGTKQLSVSTDENTKNLSQTDKFSRELFATIAAASQNGTMDQATVEQLSSSLAEHVQNTPPRKVFQISEIKIITDDSLQAFKNYNVALSSIYKKYPPIGYTVLDVLQKFIIDENNVDVNALVKLDPIINQTNKIIEAMLKMNVPQSISILHLNVINSQERLAENLSDIKLYETDAIVALGGITKYQENANQLGLDINNLASAINRKLSN